MCCGFVGDIIGGVVDVIGSVAEYVIDNALPIIETIALSYALGPAGFALTGTELTVAKAIGSAAISAINGGSLASIATAGLMPFVNTPNFIKDLTGVDVPGFVKDNLGIDISAPSSFINKSIASVITDPQIASLVSGVVGSATTGGLMAAVTGDDILEAAKYAGMSSFVSQSVAKTWDNVKQYASELTKTSTSYESDYNQVKDVLPKIQQAQTLEQQANEAANKFNDKLYEYNSTRDTYNQTYEKYLECVATDNIPLGNGLADQLNDVLKPKIDSLTAEATSFNDAYQAKLTEYQNFMSGNSATFEAASPYLNNMMIQQQTYDLMSNQIQGDYKQYQAAQAWESKDYDAAAKYYNEYKAINQNILDVNPNVQSKPIFNDAQVNIFDQLAKTSDQAQKDTLYSQASLMDTSNFVAPVNQAVPEYSQNPGYKDLPKYPGTDTGTTPSTTPSTSTGTSTGTSSGPGSTGSGLINNIGNTLGNIAQGQLTSNLVNQILGNNTSGSGSGTRPTVNPIRPKPAAKVDVSTLKPFAGTLPDGTVVSAPTTTPTTPVTTPTTPVTTPTTPVTTPTTPTAPVTTGGLGAVTNTTQAPTQTTNSGLTSTTQTKTPPTKVDVSTLRPVTDTNYLKSLGLVQG